MVIGVVLFVWIEWPADERVVGGGIALGCDVRIGCWDVPCSMQRGPEKNETLN